MQITRFLFEVGEEISLRNVWWEWGVGSGEGIWLENQVVSISAKVVQEHRSRWIGNDGRAHIYGVGKALGFLS